MIQFPQIRFLHTDLHVEMTHKRQPHVGRSDFPVSEVGHPVLPWGCGRVLTSDSTSRMLNVGRWLPWCRSRTFL